jgi:hypothetical protein
LTDKVRSTTHVQIITHCNTCVETASNHLSAQQSYQETLLTAVTAPVVEVVPAETCAKVVT